MYDESWLYTFHTNPSRPGRPLFLVKTVKKTLVPPIVIPWLVVVGDKRQSGYTAALVILNALHLSTDTIEAQIAKKELVALANELLLTESRQSRVTSAVLKWLSRQRSL